MTKKLLEIIKTRLSLMEKIKIHCNTCNSETNHELLMSHQRDYHEPGKVNELEGTGWFQNWEYNFWVCKGCDTATLEENYHSANMVNQNGDDYSISFFHPERRNKDYRHPKTFQHLSSKLNTAYLENISAYNLKLEIVTAIGLRALLEGICLEEEITDDMNYNLTGKVEYLGQMKNIPEGIIEGLKSLKFLGDNAAHNLESCDTRSLTLAIDLLEALLTHLYEAKFDLQQKAKQMEKGL